MDEQAWREKSVEILTDIKECRAGTNFSRCNQNCRRAVLRPSFSPGIAVLAAGIAIISLPQSHFCGEVASFFGKAHIATREVSKGLIHHSDRGVQYASSAYTERLLTWGIQISMSAKGNAYDNAKAESFFKTLKQEEVYLKQYQTFEDASANIGQFIDEVYNAKRLHSSRGYVPPSEFEAAYYQGIGR
jgi:putative transposase